MYMRRRKVIWVLNSWLGECVYMTRRRRRGAEEELGYLSFQFCDCVCVCGSLQIGPWFTFLGRTVLYNLPKIKCMRKMRDVKEELSFNFSSACLLWGCVSAVCLWVVSCEVVSCEVVSQLFVCLAPCVFIVQLETELILHMFKWKFKLGEYNVTVINREMSSHCFWSDLSVSGSLYRVKAELCTAD